MTSDKSAEQDSDEVRHMDVGETRTVTDTQTYKLYAPDVYFGSDRDAGEIDVENIEVVEPEREGDFPDIEVTWNADVTKQLGRRWDEQHREEQVGYKRTWIDEFVPLVITVSIAGVVGLFAAKLLNTALAGMTINGEPMGPVPVLEVLPAVLVIVVLAWGITIGMRRIAAKGVDGR